MGMNDTPSSERLHIGFFGRRNAGKSSVVNAVTNQNMSLVSDKKGTTTDPVEKTMELLPLGPVVIIDTAGFDDGGTLGTMRVERTKAVLNRVDIAVLVVDGTIGMTSVENELVSLFEEKKIPYLIVFNKCDLLDNTTDGKIFVSAKNNTNIELLKDRIAKEMIEQAERDGKLKPGSTIIEPTSGNTGIGLAAISAAKGYRLIIVLPETMSVERRNIIKAYGAELVLTEGSKGMKGAIAKAEELAKEIPNSFIPGQFVNPANPTAHKKTTGPEIWNDTDGEIDAFIAGVGTGGTVSGVGEYLKSKKSDVEVIAVEPATSPVLSQGVSGAHKIQGIGAGFVPDTLNTKIYDKVVTVENEDAFAFGKEIAKTEGILVGISSGAALKAAVDWASQPENKGKTVVALLPDSGDRYYSTALFE